MWDLCGLCFDKIRLIQKVACLMRESFPFCDLF